MLEVQYTDNAEAHFDANFYCSFFQFVLSTESAVSDLRHLHLQDLHCIVYNIAARPLEIACVLVNNVAVGIKQLQSSVLQCRHQLLKTAARGSCQVSAPGNASKDMKELGLILNRALI
jgi:hypothetical protein